jgi:hypothetical protein
LFEKGIRENKRRSDSGKIVELGRDEVRIKIRKKLE